MNPDRLDIVKTKDGPVVYYDGQPLTTPDGRPVRHQQLRLLEHITREISLSRKLEPGAVNCYALFSISDHLSQGAADVLYENFDDLFQTDPIVWRKSGDSSLEPGDILDFFEEHDQIFTFMFGGLTSLARTLNQFLIEYTEGAVNLAWQELGGRTDLFKEIYLGLPVEKKAGVSALVSVHRAGIILPLLLVYGRITPSEYTAGVFIAHLPYYNRQAVADLPFKDLGDGVAWEVCLPEWKNPAGSFSLIKDQAADVLEFLALGGEPEGRTVGVAELIRRGEGFALEFKSTLRWNLKAGKKDSAIEHACLKTLAAFLNSGGGYLLIGVTDDGSIHGIESDGFDNEDRFAQHFWNLVKASMGVNVTAWMRGDFESLDGRSVFAIECLQGPEPVFLRQKGFDEEFYIRVGPSSVKLGIAEALQYIGQRFVEPGRTG